MRVSARFAVVAPTARERARPLPGDDLVPDAVQMDRSFSLPAPPDQLWPWLVQLGKDRGGWYLPRSIERYLPPARRAVRRVVPELQQLAVGDTVPDWGGHKATLTLVAQDHNRYLLHASRRGSVSFTWALVLAREGKIGRAHV